MLSLIVTVIALAIAVVFSVQNAGPVAVSFLLWHFEASLAVVIALSLMIGMIVGMTILSWIRLRRSVRKKKARGSESVRTDQPS